MKIAYVGTYLPQQCGIATYTNYLISALRKVKGNLKVRIVAENKATPYQDNFVEVMPVWNRKSDYSKPTIKYTKGFDIIHIQHEYGIYQCDKRLINTLDGLDKASKKIATIHCLKPQHFSEINNLEQYTKELSDRLDLLIVHLPSQKAILQRLGVASNKIQHIAHGTEITNIDQQTARQKLKLPKTGKVLLMFGFIKAHKCADIILESMTDITAKFPNTYFFLAGSLSPNATEKDIKYLEFLKNKITKLGLKEKVIFPNRFYSNQDVPNIISAADIILFPYYEQDFSASGSLHLAIGAKKPVIATRIPKFEELKNISDELLILPNNPTLITNLVLRLFEDDNFLNYIIKRTDIYRKKTDWDKIATQHVNLYHTLCHTLIS